MNLAALQGLVRDYLSKAPTRTQVRLCSKAGISPKSLQRIMSGETKNPDPDTVYPLLKTLYDGDQSRIFNFFAEHAPEYINRIEKFYKLSEYDLKDSGNIAERAAECPHFYLTSILLMAEKGVTRQFIKDQVGERGLIILNNLISEDLVTTLSDEKFRLSSNKPGTMDPLVLKKLVLNAAKAYDIADFRTDRGAIFHQSRWVSEDGRREVKAAIEEFNTKLAEIFEKLPGEFPVAVYLGMSSLTMRTSGDEQ